jgi:integrase
MTYAITPYTGKPVPDHLSFDEVRRLIEICPQVLSFQKYATDVRNQLLLETLWQTGCRLGEIIGGKWTKKGEIIGEYPGIRGKDLDIRNGTITVQVEKQSKFITHTISVETSLVAQLVEYYTTKDLKREDRIFQVNKRQVQNLIKIAGKQAEITRSVNPHILRHSHAMYLRSQGVHAFVMQKALAHTNIGSTLVYSGATDEDVAAAKAQIKWR